MKRLNYYFDEIDACNFCGNPSAHNRIIGQRLNTSQGKNPNKKFGIAVSVMKCNSCALVYSNPQPIPVDIQNHYGIPSEDYWKEEYCEKANIDAFLADGNFRKRNPRFADRERFQPKERKAKYFSSTEFPMGQASCHVS